MTQLFQIVAIFTVVFTNPPKFPEEYLYGTWKQEQKISENVFYFGITRYNSDNTFTAIVEEHENNQLAETVRIQGKWKIERGIFKAIGEQKSGDVVRDFSVQCEIIELTNSSFTYKFEDGLILTETKIEE